MKKFILFLFFTFTIHAQQKISTILISFDGFRWDYLNRGLTPNFDNLISSGVKAKSLKMSFPTKTFPNHYTIVTGQYPENHGIIENNIFDKKTNKKFRINDTTEVTNPMWYKGEAIWETARKQNKITASYFWPGSELKDTSRQPNYFEKYEHTRPYEKRIDGVIDWLKLPIDKRPELITLYFDIVDSKGHEFGPNSPELDSSLVLADNLIGEIILKLKKEKLFATTNFVIVSDHGMTEISLSKVINLQKTLSGEKVFTQWYGPNLMIESENPEKLIQKLKSELKNCNVYLKSEIPKRFNFSKNENISSILIMADLGYSLTSRNLTSRDSTNFGKGNHGYDNDEMEMHGIFIASGPSFKKNLKIETFENIEIYPFLCKILKINPSKNIDGKINSLNFIFN